MTSLARQEYTHVTSRDEVDSVSAKITNALHNNSWVVRTAVVRSKRHLLLVVLDLRDKAKSDNKDNVTFWIDFDIIDGMILNTKFLFFSFSFHFIRLAILLIFMFLFFIRK